MRIYALSSDPIYIGTGGFTIGRVDNTIVRDPITKIPKIPGSSLAGTWRYYMTLKLQGFFKKNFEDIYKILCSDNNLDVNNVKNLVNRQADVDLAKNEKEKNYINRIKEFKNYARKIESNLNKGKENKKNWQLYWGNLISSIKCAGQDDQPNENFNNINNKSDKDISKIGHCGHCIVCKTFGYSKKDKSRQGLAFFSDLNILFYPVNTRLGVRWITSPQILKFAGLERENINMVDDKIILYSNPTTEKYLNLGWLNLKIDRENKFIDMLKIFEGTNNKIKEVISDKVILVSDRFISQIINANLEVRTSVSIDPLTGASKQGALFTSEAIPRGTVFYGDIRINDYINNNLVTDTNDIILNEDLIVNALRDSSIYYNSFGVGGMVTRGFGRLEMLFEK